jgi:spermidine/putrescine transport system permease protein
MTGVFFPREDSPDHPRRPGLLGWLLIAPMLIWLAFFVVAPTGILLMYSFCTRDALGQVVYDFSLGNYARVLDPTYLKIFLRSIGYAAVTTLLCILAGYPVAWCIGKAREDRRTLLLMLIMIPFWTSFLIRTYAWITILKSEGLLNGFLQYSQLISAPVEILYTPYAVVIGLVYAYLPFMILPIYGSIEKLDGAVVEAALNLGANPFRAFVSVILPLTAPGVLAGTLLVFVPAIGMFAITDLMGGARTPLLGNVIQNQFLQARDWPFGAALGMTLLFLFGLGLWLCSRRQAPA